VRATEGPVIFLDFDGVMCDSINECFVSSWIAYGSGRPTISVPIHDYQLFRSYRPFIRRGGDYVLLQRCIDLGISLNSQEDFDAQESFAGDAQMDKYHGEFYAAREELLRTDRTYWLGLNRVYPAVHDALKKAAGSAWILTTKKVDFALEIAQSQGLAWDRDRIICSGKQKKLDIIANMIGSGQSRAVFVDDQIDHFEGRAGQRIDCYLAAWGYVSPEWLQREVKVIHEHDFNRLMTRWLP
jgi:FMN phosphatase YigB (HAD superfamily)